MQPELEISVVVPTRNRWALLADCSLRSALAQEDVALEVVVVDDGSTEPRPANLRALDDPRVRVVRRESSGGAAAARNAGVAAARAPWIAFLDDDDLWSPRKLRAQLDAAERAGARFAFTGVVVLDERRSPVQLLEPPDPEGLHAQLRARYVIPAGCSNVVVDRGLLDAVGGFDERLSFLADWDLWIRLAEAGEAAAVAGPLVGYVNHDGSMIFGDARRLRAEVELFFEKHADVSVDPARFAAWIAWQARRSGRRVRAARMYLWVAVRYRRAAYVPRALLSLVAPRPAPPPRAPVATPAWLE